MDLNSKEELIKSLETSGWNLSNERDFVENLYIGRFNYFLVVLFLVWLILYRGYKKHDRIMRIIFNDKKDHPASKIEAILKIEGYKPRYKVSRLMGVYIPWICIIFLLTAVILINVNVLK